MGVLTVAVGKFDDLRTSFMGGKGSQFSNLVVCFWRSRPALVPGARSEAGWGFTAPADSISVSSANREWL